jgi:hypothetical protein
VAVLGTVLNGAYRDDLPAGAGAAVRESAASGAAMAAKLGDPELVASVRSAFTHGMDVSLLVAAAVTLAGAIIALTVLPERRTVPSSPSDPDAPDMSDTSPEPAAVASSVAAVASNGSAVRDSATSVGVGGSGGSGGGLGAR